MPYEPSVHNGWHSYVDPKRFDAEVQCMFREGVVCAGMAGDLREPNEIRRWEVVGKSLLLTRDAQGQFRAFENWLPSAGRGVRGLGRASSRKWA